MSPGPGHQGAARRYEAIGQGCARVGRPYPRTAAQVPVALGDAWAARDRRRQRQL